MTVFLPPGANPAPAARAQGPGLVMESFAGGLEAGNRFAAEVLERERALDEIARGRREEERLTEDRAAAALKELERAAEGQQAGGAPGGIPGAQISPELLLQLPPEQIQALSMEAVGQLIGQQQNREHVAQRVARGEQLLERQAGMEAERAQGAIYEQEALEQWLVDAPEAQRIVAGDITADDLARLEEIAPRLAAQLSGLQPTDFPVGQTAPGRELPSAGSPPRDPQAAFGEAAQQFFARRGELTPTPGMPARIPKPESLNPMEQLGEDPTYLPAPSTVIDWLRTSSKPELEGLTPEAREAWFDGYRRHYTNVKQKQTEMIAEAKTVARAEKRDRTLAFLTMQNEGFTKNRRLSKAELDSVADAAVKGDTAEAAALMSQKGEFTKQDRNLAIRYATLGWEKTKVRNRNEALEGAERTRQILDDRLGEYEAATLQRQSYTPGSDEAYNERKIAQLDARVLESKNRYRHALADYEGAVAAAEPYEAGISARHQAKEDKDRKDDALNAAILRDELSGEKVENRRNELGDAVAKLAELTRDRADPEDIGAQEGRIAVAKTKLNNAKNEVGRARAARAALQKLVPTVRRPGESAKSLSLKERRLVLDEKKLDQQVAEFEKTLKKGADGEPLYTADQLDDNELAAIRSTQAQYAREVFDPRLADKLDKLNGEIKDVERDINSTQAANNPAYKKEKEDEKIRLDDQYVALMDEGKRDSKELRDATVEVLSKKYPWLKEKLAYYDELAVKYKYRDEPTKETRPWVMPTTVTETVTESVVEQPTAAPAREPQQIFDEASVSVAGIGGRWQADEEMSRLTETLGAGSILGDWVVEQNRALQSMSPEAKQRVTEKGMRWHPARSAPVVSGGQMTNKKSDGAFVFVGPDGKRVASISMVELAATGR